jgi:hypothetical protein
MQEPEWWNEIFKYGHLSLNGNTDTFELIVFFKIDEKRVRFDGDYKFDKYAHLDDDDIIDSVLKDAAIDILKEIVSGNIFKH